MTDLIDRLKDAVVTFGTDRPGVGVLLQEAKEALETAEREKQELNRSEGRAWERHRQERVRAESAEANLEQIRRISNSEVVILGETAKASGEALFTWDEENETTLCHGCGQCAPTRKQITHKPNCPFAQQGEKGPIQTQDLRSCIPGWQSEPDPDGGERFEVYDEIHVAEASAHVCTAESPEWAQRIATDLQERDRLRAALGPFEDIDGEGSADFPDDTKVVVRFGRTTNYSLTLGDFRRVRAALASKEPGNGE